MIATQVGESHQLGVSVAAIAIAFVVFSVTPGSATLAPDLEEELLSSGRVTAELIHELEESVQVPVQILVTLPQKDGVPPLAGSSQLAMDVDPVIVELVQFLLPGDLSLSRLEVAHVLKGVVDAQSLLALTRHPSVIVVDVDSSRPATGSEEDLRHLTAAASSCVASSTRACVQGNRFSLQVAQGGTFKPVRSQNGVSAVFSFGSSSNWEVLAKVLNGCGINGHYWVFGAGATSLGYALHVVDTLKGTSIAYNGGALCPIADTGFFPC